jgi:hypothetical protein
LEESDLRPLAWSEPCLLLELLGVQTIAHRFDHTEDNAVQRSRRQDVGPALDLSVTSGTSPLPAMARQILAQLARRNFERGS